MDQKKCPKCEQTKTIDKFYGSGRCKKCHNFHSNVKKVLRKIKLVKLCGSKCAMCGYDKNLGALDFHHKDSKNKKYEIAQIIRKLPWKEVVEEIDKCILLCRNCHAEIHYPHLNSNIVSSDDSEPLLNKTLSVSHTLQSTGNCLSCGCDVYGTKYCSVQCAGLSYRKTKRPTKKQLSEMIKSLSWCEIGRQYGVSDNAVRKWAKKYHII